MNRFAAIGGALALWVTGARAAPAAPAACTFEGRLSDGVALQRPALGDGLILASDVAATVTFDPASPGRAEVRVRGSLVFDATAESERIELFSVRPLVAAGGALRLPAGTPLRVWAEKGPVRFEVRGIEACAPQILRVGPVALPCDAVALVPPPPAPAPPPPPTAPREQRRLRPGRIAIAGKPAGPALLSIEVGAVVPVAASLLEKRGGWSRVALERAGVEIEGWVQGKLLDEMPKAPGPAFASCGGSGFGCARTREPVPPGAFVGAATIAPGTPVAGAPDGAPWGRVGEAGTFEVVAAPGAPWVTLLRASGFTGPCSNEISERTIDRALVPRAAVRLPSPAPTPARP